MIKKLITLVMALIPLFAEANAALAGEIEGKQAVASPELLAAFHKGGLEVELHAGPMFSINSHSKQRPELNYAIETARLGWMLDSVHGSGFFRGNQELLLEALGGEVCKGPGTGFFGGEVLLRHNFVQPGARLVPYAELGGGCLYNDIYHNTGQRLIGEGVEFMLSCGGGARWMINDRWALSLETDYRHISNAGLASRNDGLNSMGVVFGLNYFF